MEPNSNEHIKKTHLYIRFRKHHGRKGRKIVNSQMIREFTMRLFLITSNGTPMKFHQYDCPGSPKTCIQVTFYTE